MATWLDMRPADFGKPTTTVAEPLFAAPERLGTPDLLTECEEPVSIPTDQAAAVEPPATPPAVETAAPIAADRPEWARQIIKALRDAQADAAHDLSRAEWDLIDAVLWSVRHRLGEESHTGGMTLGQMAVFLARDAAKRMEADQ